MKITHVILAGIIAVNFASCGGNSSSESKTVESETPAEAVELKDIPSSSQVQTAFDAIIKQSGIKDLEVMEISFGYNPRSGMHGTANFSIQMVSPKDKNKIVSYSYSFKDGMPDVEPTDVTLSSGVGSDEKFIEKYDEFKEFLFKKEDMMSFDKFDALYKKAIELSTYKSDECYVENVTIKKTDGKMENYIRIQSTKSVTAYKTMHFDKEGNIKK